MSGEHMRIEDEGSRAFGARIQRHLVTGFKGI